MDRKLHTKFLKINTQSFPAVFHKFTNEVKKDLQKTYGDVPLPAEDATAVLSV